MLQLHGLMEQLVSHLRSGEEFHGWTLRVIGAIFQIFDERGLEHLLLLVDSVLQSRILSIVPTELALCSGVAHSFLKLMASATASN